MWPTRWELPRKQFQRALWKAVAASLLPTLARLARVTTTADVIDLDQIERDVSSSATQAFLSFRQACDDRVRQLSALAKRQYRCIGSI